MSGSLEVSGDKMVTKRSPAYRQFLDTDQARQTVGPGLNPNFFEKKNPRKTSPDSEKRIYNHTECARVRYKYLKVCKMGL